MDSFTIHRSQITITGGPLIKDTWLIEIVPVEGKEFFCLDKQDRKLRKWIGEFASGTVTRCDVVDLMMILREQEEDKLVDGLKRTDDPCPDQQQPSQGVVKRGLKRNRPQQVQSLPEVITIEYPSFSFRTALGVTAQRPTTSLNVLRSKEHKKTKLYLEMTQDNLTFLHEAAQDNARWGPDDCGDDAACDDHQSGEGVADGSLDSAEGVQKHQSMHKTKLPEPNDERIKWRLFTHQKPALRIDFEDCNGKKRSKMKTPLLTGDKELDASIIQVTEDALSKLAESIILLSQAESCVSELAS